jgi:hypothetical protein
MIANDQELGVVTRQLEELKARRDRTLRDGKADGFQLHIEVTGLEKMIARLQAEVDAFASARGTNVAVGKR